MHKTATRWKLVHRSEVHLMRVLISGSHGLVGEALRTRMLDLGHSVTRLVRSKPESDDIVWDPLTGEIDVARLEGFDVVVHLAGVSIGEKRWSPSLKAKIWDSRVVSTELLSKRLVEVVDRPDVFVCASAVGYYGNRGDELLAEDSERGEGFLADLCHMWEDATTPALDAGIRVVNVRSGVILAKDGGVLARQLPLFRLGIGGRLGSGHQWYPWISLRDEASAIMHVINKKSVKGPVNLVAPTETTNGDFTLLLANTLRRPAVIPAPRWMLALPLGTELTDQLLLTSQRVKPKKLIDSGFKFQDPELSQLFADFFHVDKQSA
jgi:uncharacterized protein